MKNRIIAATILALACTGASAQGLKQVATIQIPGVPINQFGTLYIDQPSGLGYLAEKDNKAVVVFDTTTNQFIKRIIGFGGLNDKGQLAGPNGLVIVNDGAELWVSDGDSSIRIVDLATGQIESTIATGGKERANAMAYDPIDRVVIVANSNEPTPFLSVISIEKDRKIIGKIPITDSAENIERSVFQPSSGMFWTAIPVSARDASNGLLAQTNAKTGQLVALHDLDGCHPHSLQLVSDTSIFLGCSNGHGPAPKPGGDLAVFDIASKKVVLKMEGLGGNGSSDLDAKRKRYVHATTNATLLVVDPAKRGLVEKLATSAGSRSIAVHHQSDRIYLATTAKDGPCGGCILVYANGD
ncbi:MAG: putative cytochrome cd1-nitrite reductase-like, C-terminal hem d1 [Hyphomicrobiales bacterium]|nr:putative cytochrome cd1-nitrite reductase-like, C-terminal hem d1 [Hyphomicrobiales bacterium]